MTNRPRLIFATLYASVWAGLAACTVPNPTFRGDACVAETDGQFCARVGATCEAATRNDNCGTTRTVNCGTCSGGDVCVENACRGPVCSTLAFPVRTLVSSLNDTSTQDTLAGVSADGKTVLWQRGTCGSGLPVQRLLIGDSNGGAFAVTDLTDVAALAPLAVEAEGAITLTPDGLGLIGISDDGRSFIRATRPSVGSTNFGQLTNVDFAALNVDVQKKMHFPVISSDGLAFYFRMDDVVNPSNTGLYETIRTSTAVPFPVAMKMPAPIQAHEMVTGISADRLTLFLQDKFFPTIVLTRRRVSDPFTNPNAPGPVPVIAGFHIRPLGDCQSLMGTYTAGGCVGQELAIFSK